MTVTSRRVPRSLAARCVAIAAESGQPGSAASLTEAVADVETLAGDHEAAARMGAVGCDWFNANGQPHGVHEALLALSQVAAGQPVDIDRLASMAATRSGAIRALLDTALAAAHLRAGALEEAERNARSSIEFLATTDFLTFHANSALILGDILRATGRTAEADASFHLAQDLYEQKGSRVSVELVAARLAG